MAVRPSAALHAIRKRIRARSGNTLARQMTYKDMLELVDEALEDLEATEHDDYMGEDQ